MGGRVRFTIRDLPTGAVHILQVARSYQTAAAEEWLRSHGIEAKFQLRGYFYEASYPASPAAEQIAPLLQERAARED